MGLNVLVFLRLPELSDTINMILTDLNIYSYSKVLFAGAGNRVQQVYK